MDAYWKRTGDPLGDFLRLIFLVEEGLERLGAPSDGTLGEKLKILESFLAAQDRALVQDLWELIQTRNRVLHDRVPVPEGALSKGSQTVARLLLLLAKQGYYEQKELKEIMESLQTWPPTPPFTQVVILPEAPQAPPLLEGRRPKEIPRRRFSIRPLDGPRWEAWWRGWRKR
ncbi:MAG: hypothetical protein P3W93_006295 [Thermus sp.]|nr:hypothetical protein [Thermus sp.]